ncbi:host cell division inhibitor Icd-like protein [Escherichia coli]|nr:host cell division inhibitor Icd-like protein [Escherichia coli]MCK3224656.1 host cell division inhibitor Icd-like protein [Escherichia coli]MCK3403937.1 host cell division inhibitor Icd-like protein [Escherichia coli]MCK3475865.1 host cell division inhibitor Icd-like protein [Escherichia coli]MCK3625967.1 host cell division inhibitor Icd-like protein [Escherichia coli]
MCNALTVTKRESAPLPERLCERITYSTAMFAMWVNFSDKFVQCEGADHRRHSTPEMQNILLQNTVGHIVRKAKNFAGGATDTILSGRQVLINLMSDFVLDKTKATAEGRQWVLRQIKLERITNNATFAAGGQCDQSDLVRSKVCNESFFLCSLRNFSRANEQGANLSDSCSCAIFLRRLLRVGDGVLVDSVSLMVLSCKAMRLRSSNYGADSGYSCSLTLRRWSSSRATVTSCPISSAALTPIFSTCASASSEETRGFSPLPSAWRRAISPRMAVTMNPALLSPSSFTDSMPSKASCGIRIEICFDLSLIVFFAMCILLNKRCDSVYTKKNHKKYLTCDSVEFNLNHTSVRGCKRQRPELFAAVAGRLTKPLNEVTIMAGTQHTQTHPKFIYTFLAVHRDCIADGKNTVHVAADTLVDACEMLNDMGYISATWKGREENTLFIQKCENNFIWRFIALSTAQPRVIHIEATSEQEARQQSPDGCVMVFAARIRQEVHHA